MKKLLKITAISLIVLFTCFVSFILYETKDEINANLDNIEEQLYSFYDEKKLAGFAVSVFNDKEIFYTQGFGYSDLKNSVPYSSKTEQYIASISKTTIGVSLLKAEELGYLSLDDSINSHLPFKIVNPNFPNEAITIRQLATHTSSLDYNEAVVESLYVKEEQKEKSLKNFMGDYFQNSNYGEIKFTNNHPGSDWNYSNIGASLAAYIIELKSDMSYADFTKKYIFDPLKMKNTHWFESEADSSQFSNYYEIKAAEKLEEVKTSGVKLYPARDLITNVEDLTIYCQAIIAKNPALLSEASYHEMLAPQLPSSTTNRSTDNHGIGWMIDRNQYGITYQMTGMNGGDYCINTIMWFDPKTNLGYIFIGNTGQVEYNRVNHIFICRALVSLGDHLQMSNPEKKLADKIAYKSHNVFSRIWGLF